MHEDKLNEGILELFQAERPHLPEEPFMTELQAGLRVLMLTALTLKEQQARRQQFSSILIRAVLVIVLVALVQPLVTAGAEAISGLQIAIVQLAPELNELTDPLLLMVAALYAAALAWCFRLRLQRFLAPW